MTSFGPTWMFGESSTSGQPGPRRGGVRPIRALMAQVLHAEELPRWRNPVTIAPLTRAAASDARRHLSDVVPAPLGAALPCSGAIPSPVQVVDIRGEIRRLAVAYAYTPPTRADILAALAAPLANLRRTITLAGGEIGAPHAAVWEFGRAVEVGREPDAMPLSERLRRLTPVEQRRVMLACALAIKEVVAYIETHGPPSERALAVVSVLWAVAYALSETLD